MNWPCLSGRAPLPAVESGYRADGGAGFDCFRAELRSIDYQKRINAKEARAVFLELFPNLKLSVGGYYSSNSFFLYQNWLGYASQVSWNLLVGVSRMPAKLKAVEIHRQVLDAQSMALTMTISDRGPCRCAAVCSCESGISQCQKLPRDAIGDHRSYEESVAHEEYQ
jgi:hypothetical protein